MDIEMDPREATPSMEQHAPEVATPEQRVYETTPKIASTIKENAREATVTPARVLRLGSEESEVKWTGWDWGSQVTEELAFSFFGRSYVMMLLLSSLCFTILLALRLGSSVAIKVFVPEDPHLWGTLAMLLSLASLLIFFSSVINMVLQLTRSWYRLTRDTVHVFYLPNASYDQEAIRTRNRYLAVLYMAVLVIPVLAGFGVSLQDTALSFIGVTSFYSFAAFNCIVACVWMFMWWKSVKSKYATWQKGVLTKKQCNEEDEDDQVPWESKLFSNPLVMAEFGLDVLSARMHGVLMLVCVVWVLLMVVMMSLSIGSILWVVVVLAIIVSGLLLSFMAGKPSKRASKIAKHQRYLTYVTGFAWLLFILLGLIGSMMHGSLIVANLLLLAATQLQTLRRHDLHAFDEWVLPDCDEDEVAYTRCLNIIPCSGVLRSFVPSSCLPKKLKKAKARREAVDNVVVSHHCEAIEYKYNTTHRVLTADLKISFALILALIVLMCSVLPYGDELKGSLTREVVSANSSTVQNAEQQFPVCGMTWGGVSMSELAMLVLLTEHAEPGVLEEDLRVSQLFELKAIDNSSRDATITHFNAMGRDVDVIVVSSTGGDTAQRWAMDLDLWGDAVLAKVLTLLNPFMGAWSEEHMKDFVSFTADITGLFRSRAIPTNVIKYIEGAKLASNTVVVSHGATAGKLLLVAHDIPHLVVTFGSPGSTYTGNSAPVSSTHIVPENSLLSLLDKHAGYVQHLPCTGTLSDCQSLSRTVCSLIASCGLADLKLSVC
eukprot:TRINITY_DN7981_c1_g1_i1.p1 TRINITY_DN7981_c1_g1~~TRINITY_DN7981_c1_g1_i1.p1  ORF type:complete len:772 (+),score=178.64 TRINITY_DN7981_c1_g1_i1:38-2353(+)